MSAHDYAAKVGQTHGAHRVIALIEGKPAKYRMRCPRGHVFERRAWDVVVNHYRSPQCPECSNGVGRKLREMRTPEALRQEGPPEVCNCTYYGGRLLRPCNRHQGAT